MRCKLNDLVMVVRSYVGNEGRIGRIVGRATPGARLPFGGRVQCGDDWLVDGRFTVADEFILSFHGHDLAFWAGNHREVALVSYPDACLRPIRGDGLGDEMPADVGWLTTLDAINACGLSSLSQRISVLRRKGYEFDQRTVVTATGSRIAEYKLRKVPGAKS